MRCAHCDSTIGLSNILFQFRSGFHCRACGERSHLVDGEIQRIVATLPVRVAIGVLLAAIFVLALLEVRGVALNAAIVLGVVFIHLVRQWALQPAETTRTLSDQQARMTRNSRWFVLLVVPILVILGIHEVRPFLPSGTTTLLLAIGALVLLTFFWVNRAALRLHR